MAETKITLPPLVLETFEKEAKSDYMDDWYKNFGILETQETY